MLFVKRKGDIMKDGIRDRKIFTHVIINNYLVGGMVSALTINFLNEGLHLSIHNTISYSTTT